MAIESQTVKMLRSPIPWLCGQLREGGASHLSSLELGRRSGVPASTIRSLRNGTSADLYASSWGPLAAEVLKELNKKGPA